MYRQFQALVLVASLAPGAVFAADAATPGAMSGAEQHFVRDVSTLLTKRYPNPRAAQAAGYVRYTNEDETGAISYANKHWESKSEAEPSQLWYDVHGRLLGADYSSLAEGHASPPALFGIAPARFAEEPAHVHYVLKNADGTLVYGRAVGTKKLSAAGLDPMHPTAADLAKVGAVPSPDSVQTVFLFPHIWDVTVWVLSNPAGPFADKNPNVIPSHTPDANDMH